MKTKSSPVDGRRCSSTISTESETTKLVENTY